MDIHYSNKEIDLMLTNLHQRFDRQDDVLRNILKQTTDTNGKVAENIREISRLKSWRSFITGGLAVIVVLILPVLFMLIQIKFAQVSQPQQQTIIRNS